jgi:hypothetical protein
MEASGLQSPGIIDQSDNCASEERSLPRVSPVGITEVLAYLTEKYGPTPRSFFS